MKLLEVLAIYQLPLKELRYDRNTGDVALPCGVDAGETRYVIVRYSVTSATWRAGRVAQVLPSAGQWVPAVGVVEEDLIRMAQVAYDAAA